MHHLEMPVVSFICVPLVMSSLPSHLRAGNVAIIFLIIWLAIMSIIRGVNSIVWAGNVDIKLLVWCDITTKITVGFVFAVPGSALCILKHLEAVASTRASMYTSQDKRRRQIFEVMICFVMPLVFMALHYVVQGHRFDIAEDLGCAPSVYVSIAAIFILWLPPLFISLVTMVYAVCVLRHFLRHRISFATHLRNANSTLSQSRYFRLMALAIVEMCWDTGTNIYILYTNIVAGLRPWISWADVHSDFSRVGQFPNFLVPQAVIKNFIFQWWIIPVSCIFFFIFFGFSEEAVSDYRAVFFWICRNILRHDFRKASSTLVLPTYNAEPKRAMEKHRCQINSQAAQKPWDAISLSFTDLGDGRSIAPSYRESTSTMAKLEEPLHEEPFVEHCIVGISESRNSLCAGTEFNDTSHDPSLNEKRLSPLLEDQPPLPRSE